MSFKVYGHFTYNHSTQECDFGDDTKFGNAPRKVFLVVGFIVPCIIVAVSYAYIFYKVSIKNCLYFLIRNLSCINKDK